MLNKIKCKLGIHNWKYTIEERKFHPSTSYLIKSLGIILKSNVRKCERCDLKEIRTMLPSREWKKHEYTIEEKRDVLIKAILGEC